MCHVMLLCILIYVALMVRFYCHPPSFGAELRFKSIRGAGHIWRQQDGRKEGRKARKREGLRIFALLRVTHLPSLIIVICQSIVLPQTLSSQLWRIGLRLRSVRFWSVPWIILIFNPKISYMFYHSSADYLITYNNQHCLCKCTVLGAV